MYLERDSYNNLPETRYGSFCLSGFSLVWPTPGDLHEAVPESVSRIYREAALIKGRAPNAFANQIRRCLEAVCKDRGATNNVLAQNLRELANRGEIPETLAEMTDVLRKLGNIGSHAGEEEIQPDYVEPIDEFFRAVIEYVYIAPYKVEEFKKRLEKAEQSTGPEGPS